MIPINPVNDAHALLVIASLNAVLQTGFIGGKEDGCSDGDLSGDGGAADGWGCGPVAVGLGGLAALGDGGNGLSCAPIHWTTDAALHARRS